MFYITGDTHGDFSRYLAFADKIQPTEQDVMIVLGDAGLNYYTGEKDAVRKRFVNSFPFTTFCIHGNHEMRPADIPSYQAKDTAAERFGMKRNIPTFSLLKMAKFIASANRLASPLAGRTVWINIIALHGAGRGFRMNNPLRTSRLMWNIRLQSTEIRLTLYSPIPAP